MSPLESRLSEISKRRRAISSEGQWLARTTQDFKIEIVVKAHPQFLIARFANPRDASFIEAAADDIDFLLTQLERLRGALEEFLASQPTRADGTFDPINQEPLVRLQKTLAGEQVPHV